MSKAVFPFKMGELVFLKCFVEAIPDYEGSERISLADAVKPENKVSVIKAPNADGVYSVIMHTTINADRSKVGPYYVEMECFLMLHVADATMTDEAIKRGATITGHSVLYGAIREQVAMLTGRQPYGQMVLGLSVLSPQPDAPVKPALPEA